MRQRRQEYFTHPDIQISIFHISGFRNFQNSIFKDIQISTFPDLPIYSKSRFLDYQISRFPGIHILNFEISRHPDIQTSKKQLLKGSHGIGILRKVCMRQTPHLVRQNQIQISRFLVFQIFRYPNVIISTYYHTSRYPDSQTKIAILADSILTNFNKKGQRDVRFSPSLDEILQQ